MTLNSDQSGCRCQAVEALVASVKATVLELGSGEGCESPCAGEARRSLVAALRMWEDGDAFLDHLLGTSSAASDESLASPEENR